ncbi:MAG TPA: protein-methionine-sulfoxide reductase heme-binding subunit MsrQ [Bryobacteraceae bacterium]|nr:protein-methionine-sulfoxide reductase heme-binding subunit MsrQ [Bryobacteraceae bacterium]
MLRRRWTKVVVFLLCLAPFFRLAWRAWNSDLTANPIEYITHFTGDWAIRLVVITLAVTPLRRLLHLPDLVRFRRMIGLFAFFYASLHFLTWFGLDKFFNMSEIVKDFAKRRFIMAGLAAFLAMLPLALTSTTGWIRRLGGKRWQALHRLIYVTAIAAPVHYYWLVKSDVRWPVFYATLAALLLLYRIASWLLARRAGAVSRPATKRVEPAVP